MDQPESPAPNLPPMDSRLAMQVLGLQDVLLTTLTAYQKAHPDIPLLADVLVVESLVEALQRRMESQP